MASGANTAAQQRVAATAAAMAAAAAARMILVSTLRLSLPHCSGGNAICTVLKPVHKACGGCQVQVML
jgi:hypothetical protein